MQHHGMSIASNSTAARRATSEYPAGNTSADEMQLDTPESGGKARYIIATDFGTTFSAVAWLDRNTGHPSESTLICNYDYDPLAAGSHPSLQVPTESWYFHDDADLLEYSEDVEESKAEVVEDIYGISDHESTSRAEADDSDDTMELENEYMSSEKVAEAVGEPKRFHWGYSIKRFISPDMDRQRFNRIARSKLLLDQSERTQPIRNELKPILERLKNTRVKRRRIIERDEDVIADYLTELFRHAKTELENSGIPGDATFEHVLCVPAIWGADACREMQNAAAIAIDKSGLGTMREFFLVSEPEAAAAFVLANHRDELNAGELFLMLDAGGGTVDATTYKITERFPLRLSEEIVQPDGCLNGSSFVNAAFRDHLKSRLEGVRNDIEINNFTLDGILDDLVELFEDRVKRRIDLHGKHFTEEFRIQGLLPSKQRRFKENKIIVDQKDFQGIFHPSLKAVSKLMEDQLSKAKLAGAEVEKVILVGGFSGSKPLRKLLENKLRTISAEFGYRIKLIVPLGMEQTAVVQGAIIRAWDKEKGPKRFLRLSYGLQVTEEYNPDKFEAHRTVVKRPTLDRKDGRLYVHNTINWLVCKDDETPVPDRFEKSEVVYHVFEASAKKLICEEILWVSDTCTESHLRKKDEPNKSHAHIAGRIVADMTFLKKQKLIKAVEPEKGFHMRRHYKIEIQLVIIVEGRNLKFEARWPVGEGGQTMAEGQVSIAAAFRPGTK